MKRRIVISYRSYRLRGRDDRRRAKQDIRRGKEPQPRYTTGKLWND